MTEIDLFRPYYFHLMFPLYAYYTGALNPVLDAYYCSDYINIHILICTRHLAFTCLFVTEFLTPLDLHVQVLKLGLKRSPPLKIKLISRSRLTCPSSFCS